MKNTFFFLLTFFILGMEQVCAQVSINTDGSEPDPSAILDVKSDSLGFLPPRVFSLDSIHNPKSGLIAYQLSDNMMYYFNGTNWVALNKSNEVIFEVHITSEEILTLNNSTPKGLIPEIEGFDCIVLNVSGRYNFGTTPYVFSEFDVHFNIVRGTWSNGCLVARSYFLPRSLSDIQENCSFTFELMDSSCGEGGNLNLYLDSGVITNGNGSIDMFIACILRPE